MNPGDRPAVCLTLVAADNDAPPLEVRVRRAMKSLLRAYRLRCTRAEYAQPVEPGLCVERQLRHLEGNADAT